jgi:hypothetical protein
MLARQIENVERVAHEIVALANFEWLGKGCDDSFKLDA